jgi:polyketide synthase 13
MTNGAAITEEVVQEWMIQAVARHARLRPTEVGVDTAFEEVGLTSLAAVSLAAELSDAFGIEVDALVAWDHPTIGKAARAIVEGARGQTSR